MDIQYCYTKPQLTWLVILRVFIGWHFLYEGIVKLLNPKWTSLPYLLDSKGPAADFFIKLTQNAGLMQVINFVNEWSLVLIGFALIAGCMARLACIGGMCLLVMYSLSHPSLVGLSYLMPFEGSYLWIDKNLVEFAALGALFAYPTARVIGLDRLLIKRVPSFFITYKLI
ncbi:MAG: DoxX family membrane protein [Tannerellaceae bacterium]|nr:DoxX family membrane protein [Tannerellaceae bacterium]